LLANTIYNCTGDGYILAVDGWYGDAIVVDSEIKNNIIIASGSKPYMLVNGSFPATGTLSISKNYYSGGTGTGMDSAPVTGSINFVSVPSNLHIQNTSAAYGAGNNLSSTPVQKDFDGIFRSLFSKWFLYLLQF
jgi:hypothetical protein